MTEFLAKKKLEVKARGRTIAPLVRIVGQCGIIATVEAHLIGVLFARLAPTANDASESEAAISRGQERSVGKWINA
jgi:hypothetical protein